MNTRGLHMKYLISCFLLTGTLFANDFDKAINLYDQGNFAKAVQLFQKACDGGDASGCSDLGVLYANGQGVKQDYFKAVELYQKACDGGHASGFYNLGVSYANGQGVKQDKSKAKQLFGKACDMRLQQGCEAYRILNEQGH